jgi:hypothetical protein
MQRRSRHRQRSARTPSRSLQPWDSSGGEVRGREVVVVDHDRRVPARLAPTQVEALPLDVAAVVLRLRVGRTETGVAPRAPRDGDVEGHVEEDREVPRAPKLGSVEEDAVEDEDVLRASPPFGRRDRGVGEVIEHRRAVAAGPAGTERIEELAP